MDLFKVVLCSDVDYEGMVVDVKYFDSNIALISNENNLFEMELFPHSDSTPIKFPLDEFFDALEICRCELIDDHLEIKKEIKNSCIYDFEINIIHDSNHIGKLIIIEYKNISIARIYNKKGLSEIELFMHDPSHSIKFSLEKFMKALNIGKNALL